MAVYVLLGSGFEEIEALTVVDLLRRAGIETVTLGIGAKEITGGHGIRVLADRELCEPMPENLEMIVLPGGLGGVASIKESETAMAAVMAAYESGKYVAAICAAPTILAGLGILSGKTATCYPGQKGNMRDALVTDDACIQDGTVITGASAGTAIAFSLKLIQVLKGQEAADAIKTQIVIR